MMLRDKVRREGAEASRTLDKFTLGVNGYSALACSGFYVA